MVDDDVRFIQNELPSCRDRGGIFLKMSEQSWTNIILMMMGLKYSNSELEQEL